MIRRNGRTVIGSLEALVDNYLYVIAENQKLKRELTQTEQRRKETLAKLIELIDAVQASRKAEEKVTALHRERDAKRELFHTPAINETLH